MAYITKFIWSGEDLDITVLFWQPLFEEMSKSQSWTCGQGADELHGVTLGIKNSKIMLRLSTVVYLILVIFQLTKS